MIYLAFLLLIATYLVGLSFINKTITAIAAKNAVKPYRTKYIIKTLNIALTVTAIILAILVLGIESQQVSLFLSSVFAVIGIALFAQWSILSNITASLIIFFSFPYRVGDNIKVLDKDDDISGVIEEISLFHVIINHQGNLISYPNNLILQKAVVTLTEPTENSVKDKQIESI